MGRSDRRPVERVKQEYSKDREERSHKHERGKKDGSYRERSDKAKRNSRSRSPRERHRGRKEEDVKPNIKQEPRDRDYERVSSRHNERNENVRIKKEIVMNVKEERQYNDQRRRENKRHQPENPFQTTNDASGSQEEGVGANAPKEKPNFETSGALTEDTNTYRGVVIKYNEPPEARKPKRKWRFYIFKGDQQMPVLHVHRQSAYLLGRDRKIADIPVDHPSCSKQHAVLQYRLCDFTREDGTIGRRVRPYIIDLESANGTFLNNKQIEARRYYELQEKDVLKFAYSSRDYVILHENSKDDEEDD